MRSFRRIFTGASFVGLAYGAAAGGCDEPSSSDDAEAAAGAAGSAIGGTGGKGGTAGRAGSGVRGGTAGSGGRTSGGTSGAAGEALGGTGPSIGGAPSDACEPEGGEGGAESCVCDGSRCTVDVDSFARLVFGCASSLDDARKHHEELCTHAPINWDINNDASYSECGSFTRLIVSDNAEEVNYTLVFDRTSGELVYARKLGEFFSCDGRRNETFTVVTAATPPDLSGCRSCMFCRNDEQGEGMAGRSSFDDCVIDAEGRVALP